MRKIFYTQPNGVVAIVHPIRNTLAETQIPIFGPSDDPEITEPVIVSYREMTDEEIEQRAWDKLPEDAINPRFADENEIPEDRTFRNAWVDVGHEIQPDIEKAKEITKERLRAEREPLFQTNDVAIQDALISGDEKAKQQAIAERDRLRDITKAVEVVSSLDDLKEITASKESKEDFSE